jgi:hypothetical protein
MEAMSILAVSFRTLDLPASPHAEKDKMDTEGTQNSGSSMAYKGFGGGQGLGWR